MQDIAIIAVGFLMGALIILSSDQESVHMLEGKLHKLGRAIGPAKTTYRRHCRPDSLAQFVVGTGLLNVAIILFADGERAVALTVFAIAIVLCGIGGWGRIRSFVDADAELGK